MSRSAGNPGRSFHYGDGGGTGKDSTFSRLIAGELPARWVSNEPGSRGVCFHNRLRWARVMLLVVTREYMTQEQLWLPEKDPEILQEALRLAVSTGEELCPEGFRVLSNFGRGAHQSQLHAHIHVISGIAANIAVARPSGEWEKRDGVPVQRQEVASVPHTDRYRDTSATSQFELLTGTGITAVAAAAIKHAKGFSPLGFRLKANYSMKPGAPRGGEPGLFLLGGGQLSLYV
jgi:diadenosine tetraphosphate (Ap4A) HIT family hydrolase